jgi:uncharacterized protein (DUF169 family)
VTTVREYNSYGQQLEDMLRLKTAPLAVRMLEKEEDVPEGAIRPKKDRRIHISQCQAFAMSRRDRLTVAMLTEDHWCFAPLIGYGHVDKPDDPELDSFLRFPRFERGQYVGIVSAPLRSANFAPDLVVIYSNTTQLRNLLWPSEVMGRPVRIGSSFYPPSCVYSVVPVVRDHECVVTLPDPGDYARALAGEDEIIFSLPPDTLGDLIANLEPVKQMRVGFETQRMHPDFERPDFYVKLFEKWGLDT